MVLTWPAGDDADAAAGVVAVPDAAPNLRKGRLTDSVAAAD